MRALSESPEAQRGLKEAIGTFPKSQLLASHNAVSRLISKDIRPASDFTRAALERAATTMASSNDTATIRSNLWDVYAIDSAGDDRYFYNKLPLLGTYRIRETNIRGSYRMMSERNVDYVPESRISDTLGSIYSEVGYVIQQNVFPAADFYREMIRKEDRNYRGTLTEDGIIRLVNKYRSSFDILEDQLIAAGVNPSKAGLVATRLLAAVPSATFSGVINSFTERIDLSEDRIDFLISNIDDFIGLEKTLKLVRNLVRVHLLTRGPSIVRKIIFEFHEDLDVVEIEKVLVNPLYLEMVDEETRILYKPFVF
jgi:hypothetical protein